MIKNAALTYLIVFSCITHFACNAQVKQKESTLSSVANNIVGGGCDGCELMWIGIPSVIHAVDTSAGWREQGRKLVIKGRMLAADARTPVPNTIVYYWQTDNNGYYSDGPGVPEAARRHGHIRGWVKSDESGRYTIYTIRPAAYPNRDIPAHIHLSIKEPDIKNEYYVDELVFDDDRLLTTANRARLENRGGSGILRTTDLGSTQYAEHNIILGLHIPNYPATLQPGPLSGPEVGEDAHSFTPFHAWGADQGKRVCPICKYGRGYGILYFAGKSSKKSDMAGWLGLLENVSFTAKPKWRGFMIYDASGGNDQAKTNKFLEALGVELNLTHTALTVVPSFLDKSSEVHRYKIHPDVSNTILVYKNSNIITKFVALEASPGNLKMVADSLRVLSAQ